MPPNMIGARCPFRTLRQDKIKRVVIRDHDGVGGLILELVRECACNVFLECANSIAIAQQIHVFDVEVDL